MCNDEGIGEIKEEYILFLKVHFPSNVFYNFKNPQEETVDG